MRLLPRVALAAALLTSACATRADFALQCSAMPTPADAERCADTLATQENNRRAGQALLFTAAVVLGAAAGAAAVQPTPVYVVHRVR